MVPKKSIEIFLIVLFFIFSGWLMSKSFGYDEGEFRIARHQVGDFGLHIGLARSFSWGDNFPPESPFYSGKPLPYHYAFDLAVGLLERTGIRIDYAVNGISVIFFVLLLFLIYKLPQILFVSHSLLGIVSVVLFVFSSNLSFFDFFKGKIFGISLLRDFWQMQDYLYKGPFDGSIISIFSTLNPYLNQRHLIVGMALSLLLISFVIRRLLVGDSLRSSTVVWMGMLLGLSTRIHTLLVFGTGVVIVCLFSLFRKTKLLVPFIAFALLFALPHINEIVSFGQRQLNFFNPGFLTPRPVTISGIMTYWWLNMGLAILFIPFGVINSPPKQRKVFLATLPLFIIPNLFQLSFRIEHNYSLIALFIILSVPFIARGLLVIWEKNSLGKSIALVSFFGLTASGILNTMVVKNDFQYRVADAPKNQLINWIKTFTPKDSIFLARQNLYDPVTLAGRKNYFGATYYLEVMGYDINTRALKTKEFFEAYDDTIFDHMRLEDIDYIIIPSGPVDNFPYTVDRSFFQSNLESVYVDNDVIVYRL